MVHFSKNMYYTISDAARLLPVSSCTVWRWVESGKLPAYRVETTTIRIKKEALESMARPALTEETNADVEQDRVRIEPVGKEELARRKTLFAGILDKSRPGPQARGIRSDPGFLDYLPRILPPVHGRLMVESRRQAATRAIECLRAAT